MNYKIASLLCLSVLLASCSSLNRLSVDYLEPSDFSFPSDIRSVGIVANYDTTSVFLWEEKAVDPENLELYNATAHTVANPVVAVDSLAQKIAANGYFSQVVVPSGNDLMDFKGKNVSAFTADEINYLADAMGVDLILVIENAAISCQKSLYVMPEYMVVYGLVGMEVGTKLTAYAPSAGRSFYSVSGCDTILVENYGPDENFVKESFDEASLLHYASSQVGNCLLDKFLPHWATASRDFYSGGNVSMRDAAVYVKEGNWEVARGLWEKEFKNSRRDVHKMRLAHNIALSYEMEDSLDKALEWSKVSEELALKRERKRASKGETTVGKSSVEYERAYLYRSALEKRLGDRGRLSLQMKQVDEDFN